MPVSFEFLRGIVGVIGIGCAYVTGRAFVLYRKGIQKQFRFFGWIFRTVLCLMAVGLRHRIDFAAIAIWAFSASPSPSPSGSIHAKSPRKKI